MYVAHLYRGRSIAARRACRPLPGMEHSVERKVGHAAPDMLYSQGGGTTSVMARPVGPFDEGPNAKRLPMITQLMSGSPTADW